MDDTARRIAAAYSGEGERFWSRIELGRPATYPEENLVYGRREEAALIRDWLGDLAGRRVLDAGCGRGTLALELARSGARVTGVDLVPRFAAAARAAVAAGGLSLVAGDVRQVLGREARFDLVVLREVVQDYLPEEAEVLAAALGRTGAERLVVTLRQESRWDLMLPGLYPPGQGGRVDFHRLLRTFHLATPFRLHRRQEVRRRNFRSLVVEMRRWS